MRKRLITCMALILAGLYYPTIAQRENCHYSVSGKISNSNQQIIAGAVVYIKETQQQILTDPEGKFSFEHICTPQCTLVCQVVGMQPQEVVLELTPQGTYKEIILLENSQQLAEVEVKTTALLNSTQTVTELSAEAMERNKGKFLGEALKEIAGVSVLQTGPSIFKPVIHGLHSNRIIVLNNGVKQEGQQWGLDHAPEIDLQNVERLSVIKGAMAVRYGAEAMAGVVVVEPLPLKNLRGQRAEANFVGASNNRMGMLSMLYASEVKKVKGLAWKLQASTKKAGDAFAPNYNLSNTGFSELNFSTGVGYHKENKGIELYYSRFSTHLGILKAAHIGNLNDFRFALQSQQPWFVREFTYDLTTPRQYVSHDLAKISVYKTWQKVGTLHYQASLQYNQRQEFDTRRGDLTNVPAMFLQLLSQQNDISFEHFTHHNWKGLFGFNIYYQNNYNVPITRSRVFIPDYEAFDTGFYISEKYVKPQYEVELGARYDFRQMRTFQRSFQNRDSTFSSQRQFANFTSTLGFAYFLSENITFRTNIAKSWRPPAPNELFSFGLHHGSAAMEYGNADLQPESAYKWTTTLSQTHKHFSWEVTGYLQHFQNFIYLQPNPQGNLTINGYFPVFEYKQTRAFFQGIDATAEVEGLKNLFLRTKAAWLQAYNLRDRNYLPFIPANRIETSLTYKRKQWAKFEQIYLSISHLAVAEQKRYTAESDFAPPPPSYQLWQIDMQAERKINEKQSITVGFSVQNLLNTTYRDYMNRLRYFADEMGRNFIFRIKYNFVSE
ncbi:MAG: TonB-dependent receptor [Microscillaceae bacterium]|nr:TonB-dependent receptor [Microscillaceae bacterium]MDW8459675.1 TonB-dependent receptor [Cytophagales bacterium]